MSEKTVISFSGNWICFFDCCITKLLARKNSLFQSFEEKRFFCLKLWLAAWECHLLILPVLLYCSHYIPTRIGVKINVYVFIMLWHEYWIPKVFWCISLQCIMHLEDRLQEMYLKSKMLSEYLRGHTRVHVKELGIVLGWVRYKSYNKFLASLSDQVPYTTWMLPAV